MSAHAVYTVSQIVVKTGMTSFHQTMRIRTFQFPTIINTTTVVVRPSQVGTILAPYNLDYCNLELYINWSIAIMKFSLKLK